MHEKGSPTKSFTAHLKANKFASVTETDEKRFTATSIATSGSNSGGNGGGIGGQAERIRSDGGKAYGRGARCFT